METLFPEMNFYPLCGKSVVSLFRKILLSKYLLAKEIVAQSGTDSGCCCYG